MHGVNISEAVNAETYIPEQLASQITASSNAVNRVGFIGLGAMGFGMATHLLKSNFSVLGFDVIFYPANLISFLSSQLKYEAHSFLLRWPVPNLCLTSHHFSSMEASIVSQTLLLAFFGG